MLRLLYRSHPGLAAALGLLTVGGAAVGAASRIALGLAVGQLPDVVRDGLSSSAGDRLMLLFFAAGVCYATALMVPPIEDALGTAIKARLSLSMQAELMQLLCAPAGIAHLEDPAVLDRLALARGTLVSHAPADAPVALARSTRIRINALIAVGILMWFNWVLGLIMLVFWRCVRIPLRRSIVDMVRAFGGEADVMRRAFYFQALTTTPAAAKETRVFGLGAWTVEQFRRHWLDGMSVSLANRSKMNRTVARIAPLAVALNLVTVGLVARAALHGDISLGAVAVVLPALSTIPFVGSINFDDVAVEWMVAALPPLEALQSELALVGSGDGTVITSSPMPVHAIRFRGVSFTYPGAREPIYRELDLEIPAGRSTALVGANGAGKTTLIKLLARLHEPSGGNITVDGVELASLDPRDWQRRVAVVFQDFTRFPLSIADNIAIGSFAHRDDRAGLEEAARRAGVLEIVESLPLGWDTVLSRSYVDGAELSGGQWQRVALARALFSAQHGATVLALDEPTSQLDIRSEAQFYEHFLSITRGLTTILISHRFPTVRLADHICVIDGGKVIEQGDHDSLLSRDGVYATMFRLQATRFDDEVVT